MDNSVDVGLNRRGFLKFVAALTAVVAVPVPQAFADLEKDVDSIRRHALIKINLANGGTRHFNLDVEKVTLDIDLETCWDTGFGFGSRRSVTHMVSSPTYALRLEDGTQYLSCVPASFQYENDDPEEFYTIELHEAVEQLPGQNYRRCDVVGGDSFFARGQDDPRKV